MFLKQFSTLGQKQETVILLIKFRSTKGSQMFSTLDRCVLSTFFFLHCANLQGIDGTYIVHILYILADGA